MGKIIYVEPQKLEQICTEGIYENMVSSRNRAILKEKRDLIISMIFDSQYKVYHRKLEVYNLLQKGIKEEEIAKSLNTSLQVIKNYKCEVNKKINSISQKLSEF